MGGNRRSGQPRMLLLEDAECREGRILNTASWRACDEPQPYRECAPATNVSSGATVYGAERNYTADCGEPKIDGYIARDTWPTQPQSGRPCPEAAWGYRTAVSRNVPESDRIYVAAPRGENVPQGAKRQTVPLDAPDASLRGRRLQVYEDRLRREEMEAGNLGAGRAHHPARPRRPPARQEWLETGEVQMPAPLAAGWGPSWPGWVTRTSCAQVACLHFFPSQSVFVGLKPPSP